VGSDYHCHACSDALATLYAAGARKFIVWQTPAGESVPLVNTINELLNMVNFVLRGLGTVDAQTNAVKVYTKGFVVSHCMTDPRLWSSPHPNPPGPGLSQDPAWPDTIGQLARRVMQSRLSRAAF
jgi:hypothetical protein